MHIALFRSIFIPILFLTATVKTSAVTQEIYPNDYDTLNHRIIAFKFPANKKATKYILDISEYSIGDGSTIITPLVHKSISTNVTIETLPAFGRSYQWKVYYLKNDKIIDSTLLYHFSTGKTKRVDTNQYRINVLSNSYVNKDLMFFVDDTRAAYNSDGLPIWFLPDIPGVVDDNSALRDMKVTPQNTITFLVGTKAYEVDVTGKILWQAPDTGIISGTNSEQFHHEFTRLKNGNYMLIGNKATCRVLPDSINRTPLRRRGLLDTLNGKDCQKIVFATIIEYNAKGEIVWHWESDKAFSDEDIFSALHDGRIQPSSHMNAFYFDETNKVIYTSHRNIHRIVKIDYPSGKVLAEYGVNYSSSKKIYGSGLFYGQHGCRVSNSGSLYLFNNNSNFADSNQREFPKASSIIVLKEPATPKDTLQSVWEFSCDIDTFCKNTTRTGGSAYELTDGAFLVSMGSVNRIFIVDREKNVLWNGLLEKRREKNVWEPSNLGYRVSFLEDPKDIANFLTNTK